jgi:hypothetical protein
MPKYNEPILNEREQSHGDFSLTATLAQCLKATIRNKVTVDLTKVQRESLDMICTKIARICTGNPNEVDHWKDIAGYAKLISEKLGGRKNVVGSGGRGGVPGTIKPVDARFTYGATVIDDAANDNYQAFIYDMSAPAYPTADNTAVRPNHSLKYDGKPPVKDALSLQAERLLKRAAETTPVTGGPVLPPDLADTRLHGPERIPLR